MKQQDVVKKNENIILFDNLDSGVIVCKMQYKRTSSSISKTIILVFLEFWCLDGIRSVKVCVILFWYTGKWTGYIWTGNVIIIIYFSLLRIIHTQLKKIHIDEIILSFLYNQWLNINRHDIFLQQAKLNANLALNSFHSWWIKGITNIQQTILFQLVY